jgi:hypothetical protein
MTKSFVLFVCLVAVGSLAVVSPAMAGDHPANRNGFFIGVGAGWGNLGVDLGSLETDRENSFSGNFRFGWAVADNVAIGLESSTWTKRYDIAGANLNLNLLASVTTFAVTYFPGNMGLYLRGGLGFGTAREELEGGGTTIEDTQNGLGLLTAVGYEWRLTEKFALGPQAQWAYLDIGDAGLESVDFVSLSAQATWYW